jgi:hypothetical protein
MPGHYSATPQGNTNEDVDNKITDSRPLQPFIIDPWLLISERICQKKSSIFSNHSLPSQEITPKFILLSDTRMRSAAPMRIRSNFYVVAKIEGYMSNTAGSVSSNRRNSLAVQHSLAAAWIHLVC